MFAMKGWIAVLVLLVTICVNQSHAEISPTTLSPCALSCVAAAAPFCTTPDCLCTSDAYYDSIDSCLKENCTVKESLVALRFQKNACHFPLRDQGPMSQRVIWALFSLAVFSVASRLAFRAPWLKGSGFGFDDCTIVISLLLLVPFDSITHNLMSSGLGRDIWELPFDNITKILYYFWIGEFTYLWIMAIIKISIISLYLRIWSTEKKVRGNWFRIACFGMLIFMVTNALVFSLTLGFECNPISYAWLNWDGEHGGSCFDLNAQLFAISGMNIAQDLVVCFLPLPKLFPMDLPFRKKMMAVLIFMVGLFVTVCSIIRLQYLVQWGATDNPTWFYCPIALWSAIEANVSVICACLPALAGLYQRGYRYSMSKRSSAGFGEKASRRASRRTNHSSSPAQNWHELDKPTFSASEKDTGGRTRQVSDWS